jgi:putative NADH-flavin reductase
MSSPARYAVIGATGWIGAGITTEALNRGHKVTAVVRDPSRAEAVDQRAEVAVASVTDEQALAQAIAGHDAVVGAYRAPRDAPDEMISAVRAAMAAARQSGVPRIIWLGSTLTLKLPGGGGDVLDAPGIPEEWKDSGRAHLEALRILESEGGDLEWTNVSPPRSIDDGDRTGTYRIVRDQIVMDQNGDSRITVPDYAAAIVDMLEKGEHVREHVVIAY